MPVHPPWFLAASTAKSNSGGSGFILIILFGFALLYLFTRSQKNARRKAAATQNLIEVGSRVITTSGMYGTVVRADDTTYDLEVDDDVIITFAKAAITRLAPVVEPEETGDAAGGDEPADAPGAAATEITSLTKEPQREDPARSSSEG
ncbi:MAG: preprotein translocase subunit YajC [Frankiales bacterium]|nr:preprotein translocase subunit YajC [Frankiales bacterium]